MQRVLLMSVLILTAFAGCLEDESTPVETDTGPDRPINNSTVPETFTHMEWINNTGNGGAAGIWLHNDYAYLSGGPGLRIVDIADPTRPVMVHEGVEDSASRDVDILEHPNGRLYATLSAGGVKLVDVTDPATSSIVSTASVSSHNHGVVPNTTVVYNSRSISLHSAPAPLGHGPVAGETGEIDIIDFSDPANPVVTVFAMPAVIMDTQGKPKPVTATTCHDITFNEALARAYCAGVSETQIWDISDPLQPEIIQVIDWPAVNIHHGVWDARDGDLLILGDELAGAAGSPTGHSGAACNSAVEYPTSALWFFDISDIDNPTPMGYFNVKWDSVSDEEQNFNLCTTHFGDIVDGHDALVMGWYAAGTVLVDFSELSMTDPEGISQMDIYRPAGAVNTWEAREYKGYIYTGDTARGMDILRLE